LEPFEKGVGGLCYHCPATPLCRPLQQLSSTH
jgi:hypothetical protein